MRRITLSQADTITIEFLLTPATGRPAKGKLADPGMVATANAIKNLPITYPQDPR